MLHLVRRKSLALTVGILALACAVPVLAHHGFTGAYDAKRPIYIEGTVQSVTVAYPHVEMTVQVTGPSTVPGQLPKISDLGIPDVMKLMTVAPPGSYELQIAGLQKELEGRIAKGDKIALVALQNCLPPKQYRSRWLRIGTGDVVSRGGTPQTEVQGCPKT